MVEDGKEEGDFDKRSIIQSGKNLLNTIYDEDEKRPELESGSGYLIEEKSPEKALSLAIDRMREDGNGYLLTRMEAEDLKKKYPIPEDIISFHRLGDPSKKENFDPSILAMIAHSVTNFLEEKGGTAMIEGVETLLEKNSSDKFMTFLDNLVNVAKVEDGVLMMTVDPDAVPDQQLEDIEDRLEIIT